MLEGDLPTSLELEVALLLNGRASDAMTTAKGQVQNLLMSAVPMGGFDIPLLACIDHHIELASLASERDAISRAPHLCQKLFLFPVT